MARFEPYEVIAQIAAGSTGTVYRARQPELDRLVAIKALSPQLRAAAGFLDRFRAEARVLAALDDPHVVRIHDYVEDDDDAWLVMEWVEGVSLAGLLAEHGRLSPEQAVGVLRGGLLGLAHAHERGLVHRDVAPGNLLLDTTGTSKVVDFGLAAPMGAGGASGTPAYASPEAAQGMDVRPPADVYSAGAVLYTLLAGRPPFGGGDPAAMLRAHVTEPAPALRGHGRELAAVVARALDKDPGKRPPDAAALLTDLEEAAARRFGAGWVARASVAGLVTSTMGAAAVGGTVASAAGGAATPAGTAAGATAGAETASASETVVISTDPTTTPDAASASAAGTPTPASSGPLPARRTRRLITKLGPRPALTAAIAVAVVVAGTAGTVALTSGGGSGVNDKAGTLALPLSRQLPNGNYHYVHRVTATDSPTERVGGKADYPSTLNLTCGAGTCTGSLAVGGVSFKATFTGAVLALDLDYTATIPNRDAKGNPLPGNFTQHQVSHAMLAPTGIGADGLAASYTGTMQTVLEIVKETGNPQAARDKGPFHLTADVTLTRASDEPAPLPSVPAVTPGGS